MLRVTLIPNSFNPTKDRDFKFHTWEGKALREYIPLHYNPIVYLNQKRVEDFSIIPPDDSEIIITNKQEVSGIAAFLLPYFSSATLWAFGAPTAAAGFLASGLSYVAAGAIVMAGSRLLSSILTPQTPNNATQGIEQSPTYSWTQAVTRPNVGSPIPIIYGTMQTAGNIIQRRIEYVGDDEYLYLQLALCMGEVENISASDILLNNNPINTYQDAEYQYTNGNTSQDVMKYFGDIESPNDFTVEFSDTNPIVKQISGNSAQALRIFLQFPQGIYYQNNKGGLDSRTVSFKIEYRLVGDTTWLPAQIIESRFDHWEYEYEPDLVGGH